MPLAIELCQFQYFINVNSLESHSCVELEHILEEQSHIQPHMQTYIAHINSKRTKL